MKLLIRDMDRYLFKTLMKDIRKWLDEGKKVLPISINLSKANFDSDSNVYKEMIGFVEKYNVPHKLVEIEITETIYAKNMGKVEDFCYKCINEQNIHILMDDFGTGYSSLNILKDLDISMLKLDYKFLSKSKNKEKQDAIIASVVEMAKRLNLPVVAEGVETKEEVEYFNSIGVRYIQGYYFGKPMPKDKYIELLNE